MDVDKLLNLVYVVLIIIHNLH